MPSSCSVRNAAWRNALPTPARLAAETETHVKTALQRQIDATDRQIDQLVYELYGLTDDEIKLVEAATD